MSALLKLSNVSVGYRLSRGRQHIVAADIDQDLDVGQLVCLIGPNGAGKSTLLRTVAGMTWPLAGSVFLAETDLHRMSKAAVARQVSVVLTSRIGLGQLTGWDLAALGRMPFTNWSGRLTHEDEEIVATALQDAGAATFSDRLVAELSDGERQKVMLARALAQEPKLMILDEITAFLDLPRRIEIMTILRDLVRKNDRAILLSTHDLELALSMADRVWLLPQGDALVSGTPEDLVLNGAFGRAFAAEGLSFDTKTGGFMITKPAGRKIRLSGDGTPLVWTRRALERLGWIPVEAEDTSYPHVTVQQQGADLEWYLTAAGRTERHLTVESLLTAAALPESPN
jgi:iron complex transport system ATP-binding protein